MYVKKMGLFCLILMSGIAFGQTTMTDKTHQLKEVVIHSNQLQDFAVGSSIHKMDSLSKMAFSSQTLADLLATKSQLIIKSYGPGGVANPSIRGGAASHTAVIWNGVNIQSPMDGGVNFTLLPNFLFDDLTIQYGGSGTLYGSGAVSGVLHLSNGDLFNTQNKLLMGATYGSFGQTSYYGGIKIGTKKLANYFRFYSNVADNDFDYKNADGIKTKQSHAKLEQQAFVNETQLRTGDKSILKATLWYQTYAKDIQTTITALSPSVATQDDENLRMALNWQRIGKKFLTALKSVYLQDEIYYFDPSYMSEGTKNLSKSWINEATTKYIINKHQVLIGGLNYTHEKAESGNYIEDVNQNRLSVFLSHKLQNLLNNRLTIVNSIRQEWVDGNNSPIVFSSGINVKMNRSVNIIGNVSRTYSNPSLNSLHWSDAWMKGNPDLKAENGWSLDLGLDETFKVSDVKFYLKQNFFLNNITDWIVWLPNETFTIWSPFNKDKGKTLGLDLILDTEFNIGSTRINFRGAYTWTDSKFIEIVGEEEVEKDMLYAPKHRFNIGLTATGKRWSFMYSHNFVDNRLPDHWGGIMESYDLGDVSIHYNFFKGAEDLTASIQIQNVWAKNYQVMNDYAMPGRYFRLSLNYSLNFKN